MKPVHVLYMVENLEELEKWKKIAVKNLISNMQAELIFISVSKNSF